MKIHVLALATLILGLASYGSCEAQTVPSTKQLENWRKRFPEADANKDGVLTVAEADDFRKAQRGKPANDARGGQRGAPREFKVDPGWDLDKFPAHAVCYKSKDEIRAIYSQFADGKPPVVSFEKPTDGGVRIVGTGHSFMAPGYRTFPRICDAAKVSLPIYTHTGGGITGSARYKWEQENGIFQFDRQPRPKLLASIANAKWDAMMWGPYFNDRPEYYSCWIDFCDQHSPGMKFYLSDAWPQLYQLGKIPQSEAFFTPEVIEKMGAEKNEIYGSVIGRLREQYGDRVFILPTSDAMVIAAKHFLRGELPGIEGVHRAIGGKERSLWRDQLGHLGPGFDRLEGYVFYATIYGRSPELIEGDIDFGGDTGFPSGKLDRVFRKIAWQAVTRHALSGVTDRDQDGIAD